MAIGAAALIVAGGVSAVVAVTAGGGGSAPPRPSVPSWQQAAGNAFAPVARQESVLAQQEHQWEAGTTPTATFRSQLTTAQSILDQGAAAARQLPAYPGQPEVDRMYQASADLYMTVPQIQLVATSLASGSLRSQLMLVSDRVRELADRIFDQGRVLTAQGLAPSGVPAGTQAVLPLEVPDWVAEGLAAGPPLAPAPAAPAKYPPTRQGPRPTEPQAQWQAFVVSARPPSRQQTGVVLAQGTTETSGAFADQAQHAATVIGSEPDPAVTDGREVSDRLRLRLLLEAEVARLRQAQVLGAGSLASPAASVLVVAGLVDAS